MAQSSTLNRSLELAGTLPALMVAADRVAATVIQGVHGRRRVGQGDAFWQYRPFRDGDSANRIDWRQSARSRTLFVRETEWEAAASVWLWRDASPRCSTRRCAHRHQGGARRADHARSRKPAQRCRRTHRAARYRHAAAVGKSSRAPHRRDDDGRNPRGRSQDRHAVEPAADDAAAAHGTVVLVSDWLDPLEQIEPVIRYYASAGVRGHIVQVLDPAEEDLPFDGHVKFEGLEAEGQHTVRRVETVRTAYGARLAAQRDGLQRLARPANWTVHLHRTDRPPQTILLALYLAMADLRRLNAA